MVEFDRAAEARAMKTPPWLLAAPGSLKNGGTVVLDPAEARHLAGALRRTTDEEIVLIDGEGWIAEARILASRRGRVEVEVRSVHCEPASESNGVTVALAMVAGRYMDWAVQKAVEIGVRRFVPIETERSQVRRREAVARVEHWRRISMQALKQCRRPWAMEIAGVVSLPEFVESRPGGGVVADLEGCAMGDLPRAFWEILVVGPEGGFTTAEAEILDRSRWPRVVLGPHTLRSETAAIVGGAMMVAQAAQPRPNGSG